MPKHHFVLETLPPIIFSVLAAYIYDLSGELPPNVEFLEHTERSKIRFGYFRFTQGQQVAYILAIRGTANFANAVTDAGFVVAPGIASSTILMAKAANEALKYFEDRYDRCTFATGHSLGGKLLEYLPMSISCIGFNSFKNNFMPHIITFRLEEDIADIAGGHTSYWIKLPHIPTFLKIMMQIVKYYSLPSYLAIQLSLGIPAHSINRVIAALHITPHDWCESDVDLVNSLQKQAPCSLFRSVSVNQQVYSLTHQNNYLELAVYDEHRKSWKKLSGLDCFNKDEGWGHPAYYSTIQTLALNNKLIVLARGAREVYVAEFDPAVNRWRWFPALSGFKDDDGWDKGEHYSTFQAVGVNGKLLILARGAREVHVAELHPGPDTWRWLPALSGFKNEEGWSHDEHNSTFQALEINNKLVVLARGTREVYVAELHPGPDTWRWLPALNGFKSEEGWGKQEHYFTFQAVSLNNKLVVLARGAREVHVAELHLGPDTWRWLPALSGFKSEEGWDKREYYASLQALSMNGKLIVFAKGAREVYFAELQPGPDIWRWRPALPGFRSAEGWNKDKYYETFSGHSLNGRLLVLARGTKSVYVSSLSLSEDHWQEFTANDHSADFNQRSIYRI